VVSPPSGPAGERPHIVVEGLSETGEPLPTAGAESDADAHGEFAMKLGSEVAAHQYRITVKLAGYQDAITVLTDESTKELTDPAGRLDFSVALDPQPPKPTAQVEVQVQAPTVNLYSAEIASEFHTADLLSLPSRGERSLDDFALLGPGVFPAPQGGGLSGPGISPGVGAAGQFSANGLRARGNNFTVDLSDDNDDEVGARRRGFVFSAPLTLESTAEFQVISALADARYGRAIGAQANAFSPSGMSKFHLTAYSLGGDDNWSARNFFDRPLVLLGHKILAGFTLSRTEYSEEL
jgi:hypothetical protein